MFWWMVALVLFIGWAAGLDLIGLLVIAFLFVLMTLGSIAGVDRRRRRLHPRNHYHPFPPHPSSA